jgi:hypothetical protein
MVVSLFTGFTGLLCTRVAACISYQQQPPCIQPVPAAASTGSGVLMRRRVLACPGAPPPLLEALQLGGLGCLRALYCWVWGPLLRMLPAKCFWGCCAGSKCCDSTVVHVGSWELCCTVRASLHYCSGMCCTTAVACAERGSFCVPS